MEAIMAKSHTKREKLARESKRRRLSEMRAALPDMTREQIRKHRLPFYQAVFLELEDTGYYATLDFLKQLIDFQDNLRAQNGPDSAIWTQPLLIDSKKQLELIQNGLKAAENAHRAGYFRKEFDEMLNLSLHYYNMTSDEWWWLAEQLLIQCVNISAGFEKDRERCEAVSRYILALFYMEKRTNTVLARDHLFKVKKLTKGKSWNAKSILERKQDRMYIEVCIRISHILVEEGKSIMYKDANRAEEMFMLAQKYARTACFKSGEAEALKLMGICGLMKGEFHNAAICFYQVLTIQMVAKNPEKIFEARLNLALAYLNTERTADGVLQLQYSAFEEDKDFAIYISQAHKYLGEYYLSAGNPKVATPLLIKALRISHEIGNFEGVEQSRNLAAVSAAQELISLYIDLIKKSMAPDGGVDRDAMMKMLKWKDSRAFFWKEISEEEQKSGLTFEKELMNKEVSMGPDDKKKGENEEEQERVEEEKGDEGEEEYELTRYTQEEEQPQYDMSIDSNDTTQ